MKSFDEYERTARDEPAFSNSTNWEIWQFAVCLGRGREVRACVNDADADEGLGCPLIALAVIGKTPAEWLGVRGEAKGQLVLSCREKTTPADARRAAREADAAAEREALEAAHYPMFPEVG